MAKFQAGQSGNPNGRPKGSADRRSALRQMLEEHQSALIEKAVSKALGGNEAMLRLLLERMLPSKPKDEPIDILCGLNDKSLPDQIQMVVGAFSQGEISPLEAKTIMNILEIKANLVEICEFDKRLQRLEQKI